MKVGNTWSFVFIGALFGGVTEAMNILTHKSLGLGLIFYTIWLCLEILININYELKEGNRRNK